MTQAELQDKNSYYYLWYLEKIGVIKRSNNDKDICPKITSTLWDKIVETPGFEKHRRRSRVALIDVGVSKKHPNLKGQISKYSIDLASNRYGVKYVKSPKPGSLQQAERLFGALGKKIEKGKKLLISGEGKFLLSGQKLSDQKDLNKKEISKDKEFYNAVFDELVESSGVVLDSFDEVCSYLPTELAS